MAAEPRSITLDEIFERYEAVLLDAYGVLINREEVLPGAAGLIERLHREHKPFCILTNDASRLPETSATRMQERGLEIPVERVITSSALLGPYFEAQKMAGARCVVLGPEDSRRAVERAGGVVIDARTAGEADAIIACDEDGYPFLEMVDATLGLLLRLVDAGRPPALLLPNPDLIYPKGNGRYGITGGSIALILEEALRIRYPGRRGLRFVRLGKPHPPMFEEAFRRVRTRNAIMIGDQLATDILGAHRAGIDSVLVGTGLTHGDPRAGDGPSPTWLLAGLA